MADSGKAAPGFSFSLKDGTKFLTNSLTEKVPVETSIGQIDP